MWISETARTAGVNPQTLRYYERKGLVRPTGRRRSGYREYSAGDVRVLRFVKRAQALGFSLRDVSELLKLRSAKGRRTAVRAVAEQRLRDLEDRIRDLQRMRDALQTLITSCHEGSEPHCPILEALDGSSRLEHGQ